jgi:DNA replication protein DnaC
VAERIEVLCGRFRLPTVAAEAVPRFRAAQQAPALETLVEVLELPAGKTFETLDRERLPGKLQQQLDELARGDFLERSVNVLAFGLPGTGKSHALSALGHRLVEQGHAVRFAPTYEIVQELLAAKRELELPQALRKLDRFELLILDDLGYLKQHADEAEVLFTLIAERYERRSIAVTSNVVFSQWQEIFQSPMATAAAIDRVVHHSAILEFDVPSFRTAEATANRTSVRSRAGGSGRSDLEEKTQRAPSAQTRRKAGTKR